MIFTCPVCSREYGDPLYHGPAGHAPHGLCLDCWVSYWESRWEGRDWSVQTLYFWLVSIGGYTQAEASDMAGVSDRHARTWCSYLRRAPQIVSEIIAEFGQVRDCPL